MNYFMIKSAQVRIYISLRAYHSERDQHKDAKRRNSALKYEAEVL